MKNMIFLLLCMPQMVLGLDKEFLSEYFISDLSFVDNKVGVYVRNGSSRKEFAYEIDRKTLQVAELNLGQLKSKYTNIDLSHKDFLPDASSLKFNTDGREVSYEYIDCKIFKYDKDDLYRPLNLSVCNEIKIKIGTETLIVKSRFYYDQKLTDPVIFENFLIFKIYLGPGITDRGVPYSASVDGIIVFDLSRKEQLNNFKASDSNVYSGTFISLIKKDPNQKMLWIGNKYGLYGLNEKLEEKISCFYIRLGDKLDFKCSEADFTDDNKWNQAELLNKKLSGINVANGSKTIKLRFECFEKNRKLFDEFAGDKNPNKWKEKRYEIIVNCFKAGK